MISITDENTILITARFMDSMKKEKPEKAEFTFYDIDLIVKKDITCNQLMEAIYFGLKKKVKYYSQSNESSSEIGYGRRDSRNPETEKGEIIENSDEKSEKDIYLICLDVFEKCYVFYNNANNINATSSDKIDIHRIGVGSINFRCLDEDEKISVAHENQVWLIKKLHGVKKLYELGFMTSTRVIFDVTGEHTSAALFQDVDIIEGYKKTIPLYNISDRPLLKLDDESVQIIPPPEPPQKNKQDIISTLLSPILMMAVMSIVRLFSGSGFGLNSIIMYLGMGMVSVSLGIYNWKKQNNEYKKELKEWREHYETYIQNLILDIKEKQKWDIKKLQELYPSKLGDKDKKNGLIDKINCISGDIFSRGQEHPDFLAIRLGLSSKESQLVPSIFPIIGEKKDVIFTSNRYINIEGRDDTPFSIFLGEEVNADCEYRYLNDLPVAISEKYGFLEYAPVLLRLKECETLGIVFPENMKFQPFLENILLDMCFYHSPDDLQLVMFCQKENDWRNKQEIIDKYKHLPHFRELLGDLSAFAFNKNDANKILNKLLEILSDRKKLQDGTKHSQIVMIFLDEYDEFKRHPVAEYLAEYSEKNNEKVDLGISFIFCKRYREELPKYCGYVIEAKNEKEWYLLPHTQVLSRPKDKKQSNDNYLPQYCFIPDAPPPEHGDLDKKEELDKYCRAYKILSALYYYRIAQGAGVPEYLDLFELYNIKEDFVLKFKNINVDISELEKLIGSTKKEYEKKIGNIYLEKIKEGRLNRLSESLMPYILDFWGITISKEGNIIKNYRDVTKTLKVPLGKKSMDDKVPVYLDLHEKADGPHMLVAGTTGSGKTESILTYLIGLCTLYTPQQINLLLMDMKGAGFVKRMSELPHVVGTVTDVDGDENGTSMEYMLKRFLHSMNAEVKRRKLLLKQMDVDSIDGYIKAKNHLQEHVEKMENLSIEGKKIKYMELEKLPLLPHLFLVVDEFTELMSFTSENNDIDFKSAITSLARIGRSLGFHIILISQNIESAITDDIRVNSRARLCLKVATREASREMIGTDIAYGPLMPGLGRAYLWIDGGSRFEYFQSGFSGADSFQNVAQPVRITHAEMDGEYTSFYDSEDEKEGLKNVDNKEQKSSEDKVKDVIFISEIFSVEEEDKMISGLKSGFTQIELLAKGIKQVFDYLIQLGITEYPHKVFQSPLPNQCYFDFDWNDNSGLGGKIKELHGKTKG